MDHHTSRTTFRSLAERPRADVLIIGGGINGLATFRDLALQGIDVALVERGDIVSGASAASSHMIHGGIRYLENGEFRLVHEAVTERNALLRLAPHYVRPLRTTIPIFSTFSGLLRAPGRFLGWSSLARGERGAVLIKVGLVIYDAFSGARRARRHAFHGRRVSLRQLPHLTPRVRYTATYWDASVHDPERLAVDVMRDGLATSASARAVTYVSAAAGDGAGVVLEDVESGERTVFHAPVVINATGPWTDLTNAALGDPTRYMGGTKGSHIVLDNPQLAEATGGRELFFENSDGRIVLVYPLKGRVLVGTSDLEHDMRDPIVCTEAEIDYFLALVGEVLPDIPVDRSQIVYRFSGVRPLPGHGDTAPGAVSRDYRIERAPMGLDGEATRLSLVGGKWTTFRASAERVADAALDLLGRARRTSTRRLPIGGGRGFPTTARARTQWLADHDALGLHRAQRLLDRYGTVAGRVITAIAADPDDRPLSAAPEYSTGELRHLARTEYVRHVADLVLRRTDLAFTGAADADTCREVAEAVAPVMGWDAERVAHEVERAVAEVTRAVADPGPREGAAAAR